MSETIKLPELPVAQMDSEFLIEEVIKLHISAPTIKLQERRDSAKRELIYRLSFYPNE